MGFILLAAVAAVHYGCRPTTENPKPTTTTATASSLPAGTACASLVIACYDELSHEPAGLINFRPTSRWNHIDLTWKLAAPWDGLPVDDQVDAIERALQLWSDSSSLTFMQADEGESADLTISFVAGNHGDPFPFDDAGTVLGHSYFPGTNRKGDVHLCSARDWALSPIDGQFDLFTVVLHETGHALGL
ncbi:MAG: matrixin family metalloprotease, partial [Thermoplasmata archaeon]